MTTTSEQPAQFGILFVCSANVCRSPFAEFLTRRLLSERLGGREARFAVSSAGSNATEGDLLDSMLLDELAARHMHRLANRFRARQVAAQEIRGVDLVLTAERVHRSAVAELEPSAVHKAFCLREWNRLLAGVQLDSLAIDPVERARALVRIGATRRGIVGYATAEDDAIRDPRRPREADRHDVMRMITENVRLLVDKIAPQVDRDRLMCTMR